MLSISRGNRKVEANIFNLPAIGTCKPGTKCSSYCYALKAERIYKAVKPSREKNLLASQLPNFVENVVEILKKRKSRITRIHESGDFYSLSYLKSWYEIARQIPDMKFYAYTKRDDIITPEVLKDKPENLIISYSLDGIYTDTKQAALDAQAWQYFDNVTVVHATDSNCSAQDDKTIHCGAGCMDCIRAERRLILFRKH